MRYVGIGFYLITPLLLGLFVGLWLDNYLNSKPVYTIIGICLGAILTFFNLIKSTKD